MEIKRFDEGQAYSVSKLVQRTLREINIRDYTHEYIEEFARSVTPEYILKKASKNHMYVACEEGKVLGCGAIGYINEERDECGLFTVFVSPDHQSRGVGKMIINALERDEIAINSKRIEVSASLTAFEFYLLLGYSFKYKNKTSEVNGAYIMEKYL